MRKKERNRTRLVIGGSYLYIVLVVFFMQMEIDSYGQLDSCFTSLRLSDFEHAYDLKDVDLVTRDFVESHDVVPFETLFLERVKGGWAYETDSCLFDNHSARFLDSFDVGTKLVYCGLAMSPAIESRKGFRSVSFRLPKDLYEGDTLSFSFITLADGIGGFQPSIFFSKKIKIKLGPAQTSLLKNGRYLKYAEKMPNRSMNDLGLTTSTFELVVTKKNEKLKWIHLVNDVYRNEGGFVVSACYTISKKSDEESVVDSIELSPVQIYFDNDSYQILDSELLKLNRMIEGYKLSKGSEIRISAFADKSGDLEKNLILASNRAKSVIRILVDNGVSESNIRIEELSIGNFGSSQKNRVCNVRVIN